MKRFAVVVAAVLVVSACQAREEAPEAIIDTPVVAPAPVDTGMMMPDTMMMDTTPRP